MYVVSVSGPKMYGADNSNWVENGAVQRKMLTNTQLWQVISVEGDKLTYKAKTATGRLHDQFTINKPAGQAKIITEDLANVKEEGVGGVVPGTLSLSLGRRADRWAPSRPASPRTTRPASPPPSRPRRPTRR